MEFDFAMPRNLLTEFFVSFDDGSVKFPVFAHHNHLMFTRFFAGVAGHCCCG